MGGDLCPGPLSAHFSSHLFSEFSVVFSQRWFFIRACGMHLDHTYYSLQAQVFIFYYACYVFYFHNNLLGTT